MSSTAIDLQISLKDPDFRAGEIAQGLSLLFYIVLIVLRVLPEIYPEHRDRNTGIVFECNKVWPNTKNNNSKNPISVILGE